MKIQLKRSNVLDGSAAKKPTAGQMEYGELAVNYSNTDPAIFLKDSNDNIVRIAGGGSEGSFDGDYNSLTNKPTIGDGALTVKDSDGIEVATFTANQTGPTELNLPAGFSGDYNDLTNQPTIGDGTITIKSGGTDIGTFTVNQTGSTDIDIPATSWGDVTEKPIYIDTNTPGSPNNGDLWVDLNECPPELKIWSDCSGTGQWEAIEGTADLVALKPTLSGNPSQGEVLTSTEGQAVGGKPPFTFTYDFKDQNNTVLQSSATRTYTLLAGDLGKTVTVTVTALDSRGTSDTSDESNAIGPIVPPELVNAPTLLTPAGGSIDLSVNSITMTCSAYSGVQSVYGSTTWQVSTASDFSSTVYDVTNNKQTANAATFSPALNHDSTYYARCRHTSSTGIASDFSNVNTFTTESSSVDPNVPNADMSGLRFDATRKTALNRSLSAGSTFTYSCWAKYAKGGIIFPVRTDTGYLGMLNGSANYYDADLGGNVFNIPYTLPLNEWEHWVLQVGPNSQKLYIDGELIGSNTLAGTATMFAGVVDVGGKPSSNAAEAFDGYQSEVYLVDGSALEPTAFGKEFPDGRWGPLDSSIIIDNINNAVVQPYDERANTDQVWSNNFSGQTSGSATDAFDGDTTTSATVQNGTMTFAPSPAVTVNSSISFTYQTAQTTQYRINGGDWTQLPSAASTTVFTVGFSGSLTSIEWNAPTAGELINLRVVSIDGRPLVDQGVWNPSNWIDQTTYDASKIPLNQFEKLFDGVPTNSVQANQGNTDTLTWDSGVIGGTSGDVIRIFFQGNITTFAINGTNRTITQYDWFTVPENYLTSLEVLHPSAGNICNPGAIEVNGEILVDSGALWNTSEVWSDNGTISGDTLYTGGGSSYKNGFDGNLSTGWVPSNALNQPVGLQTFTFDNPISCTQVDIYYYNQTTASDIQVNGSYVGLTVGTTGAWHTVINSPGSTFTSVAAEYKPGSSSGIYAIRVDGEILVDKGSFGNNGFYLPFDPTNAGVNYSSSATGMSSSEPASNGFDGTTSLATSDPVNGPGTLTFNDIAFTKLEIQGFSRTGTFNVTTATGTTNIGTVIGNDPANGGSKVDVTSTVGGAGVLKSFELGSDGGSNNSGFSQVWIDGKTLLDHNNIGVDASGQGNNFHDQNFALNSTGVIYKGTAETNAPSALSISTEGLFTLDTTAGIKFNSPGSATTNYITVTLNNPITTDGKISCLYNGVGPDRKIQFNSETPQTFIVSSGGNYRISELVAPTVINSITVYDASGQGASGRLSAFYDSSGNIIVDANYQDTVTDTPMRSYAVLDDGKNGNLATTANTQAGTTSSISATKKVYAETTITLPSDEIRVGLKNDAKTDVIMLANRVEFNDGDLVGIAVDVPGASVDWYVNGVFLRTDSIDTSGGIKIGGNSGNTGTNGSIIFNFGQQPFVLPNGTYNQATGSVQLPFTQPYDKRANNSQVWSGMLTSPSALKTPAGGFNGLITEKSEGTGGLTFTPTTSIPYNNSVEVYVNGPIKYNVNGAAWVNNPTGSGSTWMTVASGSGTLDTLNSLRVDNPGFDAGWNAVRIDGRLLADTGLLNNSQNWSENLSGGVGTNADNVSPSNAFDGNLSTFYRGNANTPITFDCTGLGLSGDVEIAAISGGSFTYNINDGANTGSLTTNTGAPAVFASTGHTGAVTKIAVTSSGGSYNLAGFRVGGAVLVDEGAQWNLSDVWSDNTAANNIGSNFNGIDNVPSYITNIFNGSTIIGLYPEANTVSTIDLTALNMPSGTFEVYLGLNGNENPSGATYNGNQTITGLGPAGWYTLPVTPNTIEVANTSGNFQYGLHAIRIDNRLLVDGNGGTYSTLFQTWDEYATFGLFVYDANQGKAIRTFELNKTYGLQDVLTAANVFRLTAQPRYKVISYIENNGEYSPLEDVSEELIAANATIYSLQSELDTTQAELTTASEKIATNLTARTAIETDVSGILARLSGLESDEIVDDATDTTLLTAFAALVARVEALENP